MKAVAYFVLFVALLGLLGGVIFYEDEMKTYFGISLVSDVDEREDASATNQADKRDSVDIRPSPVSNQSSEASEKKRAIQEILSQRYPKTLPVAFNQIFPSLSEVPTSAFPERIQSNISVNFTHKEENSILAASFVKPGGMVQPLKITDDNESLEVASLANSVLKSTIPISQTDILPRLKNLHEQSQQRAISRIEAIWKADAAELESNRQFFSKFEQAPSHWEAYDDPGFRRVRDELAKRLDIERYQVTGFFSEGRINIQTDTRSGQYTTIAIRIEGYDSGFGPYMWRARCVFASGKIVEWIGLPE